MRNLLIAVLLFAASGVSAQEKSKTDSLVRQEFFSTVLQEKRRIVIQLPLNYYKENKEYPVVYVLDAGRLNFDVSNGLFVLSNAGLVPESIVVGILNAKGTRERDLTPPFMRTEVDDPDSPFGKGDLFLEFIQKEVVTMVDSSYRTAKHRALAGNSRAGLLVLYSLIELPELFNARFCYSTPAWRFDNILLERLSLSLKEHRLANDTYLFFSVGDKENANILSSFALMKKMLKDAHARRLKWTSYLTPLADHQTNALFSLSSGMLGWGQWMRR